MRTYFEEQVHVSQVPTVDQATAEVSRAREPTTTMKVQQLLLLLLAPPPAHLELTPRPTVQTFRKGTQLGYTRLKAWHNNVFFGMLSLSVFVKSSAQPRASHCTIVSACSPCTLPAWHDRASASCLLSNAQLLHNLTTALLQAGSCSWEQRACSP